ncbi:MAG: thioredoxin family protein, partial [Candidatus Omnitrophica bacterium]|nr:thioredoxin family protein [Candidatus Omnitrophota bacterium]
MSNETLDLKAIFEAGVSYENWDKGEKKEIYDTNYADALLSRSDKEYLHGVETHVPILAICEPWCGDVQRQLPILARLCAENQNLDLRIINRDEHPEVMERYLTNGALAIPVFVFFNQDFIEVGNWKA